MNTRWPRWVYDHGTEPDPRFSFANERTFLAWLRTSLALVAGAVALDAFEVPTDGSLRLALVVLLLVLGMLCAVSSFVRWARAERAMRLGEPLPSAPLSAMLSVGLVVATTLLLFAVL